MASRDTPCKHSSPACPKCDNFGAKVTKTGMERRAPSLCDAKWVLYRRRKGHPLGMADARFLSVGRRGTFLSAMTLNTTGGSVASLLSGQGVSMSCHYSHLAAAQPRGIAHIDVETA